MVGISSQVPIRSDAPKVREMSDVGDQNLPKNDLWLWYFQQSPFHVEQFYAWFSIDYLACTCCNVVPHCAARPSYRVRWCITVGWSRAGGLYAAPPPGPLCIEMDFMWSFSFNWNATILRVLKFLSPFCHFLNTIKVSKSWKQFMVSSILPKNERNALRILKLSDP